MRKLDLYNLDLLNDATFDLFDSNMKADNLFDSQTVINNASFTITAGVYTGQTYTGDSTTDRLFISGPGTVDISDSTNQLQSIEEIEFAAAAGQAKTLIISAQELDSSLEIPSNFLIDGNANGAGAPDTLQIEWTGSITTVIDWSGWVFQDWQEFDIIDINMDGANTTLTSTNQAEDIFAGAGNDTINAGGGNDIINAGADMDTVNAGDGDDIINDTETAGTGNNDVYDGGTGIDTLVADVSWSSSVEINLLTGFQTVSGSNRDSYANIENVTAGGDVNIVGDNNDNVLTASDAVASGNNTISGNGGNDTINAGAGNDTINAGSGNDTVLAGDGNDVITDTQSMAASDDDVYDGGAGIDTLIHNLNWVSTAHFDLNAGFVTLDGNNRDQLISIENLEVGGSAQVTGSNDNNVLTVTGTGANIINGLGGDDTIDAGGGNDTINAGAGNDTVLAGDGDDVITDTENIFTSGAEDDVYNGGAGIDTLVHNLNWVSTVHFDLNAGFTIFSGNNRDQLISIENLEVGGSAQMTGSNVDNVLTAIGSGANIINALDGNDTVNAGGGNDTINAGDGDDIIEGGEGADAIDGGAGIDTATYANATAGVTIGLDGAAGTAGEAIGDALTNVETLIGSAFDDVLTSSTLGFVATATIFAGDGNDTVITANTAFETLDGGAGIDTLDTTAFNGTYTIDLTTGATNFSPELFTNFENLISGNGNDRITGTSGDNVITTNDGNDIVEGGAGADTMNGGAGIDTLSYESSASGVLINMSIGQAEFGDAAGDIYSNFENLTGSAFNDNLIGDNSDNVIMGLDGNDGFHGLAGLDQIFGGAGDDSFRIDDGELVAGEVYDGGTGTDTAQFFGDGSSLFDLRTVSITNFETLTFNQVFGGGETVQINADQFSFTTVNLTGSNLTNGASLEIFMEDLISLDLSALLFTGDWGLDDNETLLIQGDADAETITGSAFGDTINGGAGNDIINGNGGADVINGGDGDDLIIWDVYNASESFDGGAGIDTLQTSGYAWVSTVVIDLAVGEIRFSDGTFLQTLLNFENYETSANNISNESVIGTAGDNIITMSAAGGVNTVEGGAGADTMDGGAGIDTLSYTGSSAGVTVNLTTGTASGGDAVGDVFSNFESLLGSAFDDILRGDAVANTLTGGLGIDRLFGEEGDDFLFGNEGNDIMFGGDGVDDLRGGDGNDTLRGDNGDDLMYGDAGNDTMRGGINDDTMYGGLDDDVIYGDAGFDRLFGQAGNDILFGGGNDDLMTGGNGDDRLFGGAGDDTMTGGANNDRLVGQNGNDVMNGGDGNDVLVGGNGLDEMWGGTGNDRFISQADADTLFFEDNFGADIWNDFENGVDLMDFTNHTTVNSFADLTISQAGAHVRIENGADSILLLNTNLADIDATDFVF